MTDSILRFAERHGAPAESLEALSGDVSERRYFRLSGADGSVIVCLYPAGTWETAERFLRSGELLAGVGVRVPEVLAVDPPGGLMLLEDLGESTCYQPGEGYQKESRGLFARAAGLVPRIQCLDLANEPFLLPPLDAAVLNRELQLAIEALDAWSSLDAGLMADLDALSRSLGERIATMPLTAAHRDFMVRNLVPLDDGELGVLDHQDLRPAPNGYDFVSLMNDSLFPPHDLVDVLRRELLPELASSAYSLLAVQRTLKAVGTYARAAARGNRSHVPLIDATLARFTEHLERLDEAPTIVAQVRSGRLTATNADPRQC